MLSFRFRRLVVQEAKRDQWQLYSLVSSFSSFPPFFTPPTWFLSPSTTWTNSTKSNCPESEASSDAQDHSDVESDSSIDDSKARSDDEMCWGESDPDDEVSSSLSMTACAPNILLLWSRSSRNRGFKLGSLTLMAASSRSSGRWCSAMAPSTAVPSRSSEPSKTTSFGRRNLRPSS